MKYKNQSERTAARRLQNRLAKQRQRANIKLVKKPLAQQLIPTIDRAKAYRDSLLKQCAEFPFSHSISLTNKKLVTLNMHNKAVNDLIEYMVKEGKITNYVKTTEFLGGNYHSHLVVQQTIPEVDIKEILEEKWFGNGFFRCKIINTNEYRLNAINYCFKEIDITSKKDLMQALVDSWLISLPTSFEALRGAKEAFAKYYIATHGFATYYKVYLQRNGDTE